MCYHSYILRGGPKIRNSVWASKMDTVRFGLADFSRQHLKAASSPPPRPNRQWRHLTVRQTVEAWAGETLLTFCFGRFCLGFLDGTSTVPAGFEAFLSSPSSRQSAGIQQRWNGCLKRTIPSVKGLGLLWNMRASCHVMLPPFCSAPYASICATLYVQICMLMTAPPENDSFKTKRADIAWLAQHANMYLLQVKWLQS